MTHRSNSDTSPARQTLKALRTARGWTQFQLAVKAGVSLSTVVNIETDRQIPGLTLARKLADALGVASVEDIAWPTPDVLKRRKGTPYRPAKKVAA